MKVSRSLFLIAGTLSMMFLATAAFGSCTAPANAIEAENCLPGTPQAQWDVDGAGDPSIQGFTTDISVNAGQTINFKISTNATAYRLDIYRLGYYGGDGARLVTTIQPSARLPQTQPACLTDATTGLVDCGNWAISASWAVPSTATSGIYFAHLVRTDTGDDSHVVFVVRKDSSHSAVLFQTADETWEAYNGYAGASLYGPTNQFDLTGRAYKVSYNRPNIIRGFQSEAATWLFGAEYPMVRWLEKNGYDVTYFTGVDAARNGTLIKNHKLYLSVGHDEYWTGPHRTNVEAARDAGVNLAFFSGNEVFWKTRWENSVDGSNTPFRTLVCYKETLGPNSVPTATGVVDPLDPPTWTGTWRDPIKSPPADGGRPENGLTGTVFMVNGPGTDNPGNLSIQVPAADGKMRFWRNTTEASLAAGQTATLPAGTLGYEWDVDLDNGARPAGTFDLSTSTHTLTSDFLLDQGGIYGAGTATHHLTLHRAASGALVFGAGTIQWSWGLDDTHDNPFMTQNSAVSADMQQATVNLFADMGVQPATLQAGLVTATASTDTVAPSSTITFPHTGAALVTGTPISITGTAADTGGVVGGVEISLDGGSTWHPASGRSSWAYAWTPGALGQYTIETRATDDSGNIEARPTDAITVTISPPDCPCTGSGSSGTPAVVDSGDASSTVLGVRFRTDFNGYITGVRFYKASTNTGTHVGSLWSNTGTLLATATFKNETASGWQTVSFSNPVAVTANTTYVASYLAPAGHYSFTSEFFSTSGLDSPPIHLLASGVDGANGVFTYSTGNAFPTSSFQAANYWVDVIFVPSSSMPGASPALLAEPSNLTFAGFLGGGTSPSPQIVNVYNEGSGTLNWSVSSSASWLSASPSSGTTPTSASVSINTTGLTAGTYTGTLTFSATGSSIPAQTVTVTLTVTNLLMFSNFADGTMNGWAFSPLGLNSNWSVVNGALQYNGGGHTQVYAGNSAWTDYNVSVGIKLATLNNYPGGIRGRLNPATGAGYAVWLYPAQGLLKLFKNTAWNIDTGLTTLGQAAVAFDTTNFHNVQLSFAGSQISVLYDGQTVITVTDATYTSGLVALDTSNQVINFTNVMATASTANTGSLTATPASMTFSSLYGTNPAAQNLTLGNAATGSLVYTASGSASWLAVSPTYGATGATVQVAPNAAGLAPGTYNGTVTLVALGSVTTTKTIPVTFTITTPPPSLVVLPSTMNFFALSGQSPAAQTLAVSNGAPIGSFSWSASSDSSWLTASPLSGSTPASMLVSVNSGSLANGTYTGNIKITATGIAGSPATVPVSLQVLSQDMKETFSDNATGWIVSPMGMGTGWSVSNGVYTYSGLGLSQSCTGNVAWTDYTFDTNVKLSNMQNWPGGIRGRVNPATGAGYAVWLYPALGEAILYNVGQWSVNGSILTQLASANLTLDTNTHDLKLDFHGNVITVFWDGNPIMSTTDSTYASGYVCLDADNQPISYSNVSVNAVQAAAKLDAINPSSLVFNGSPTINPTPQTLNVTAGGANVTWAASTTSSWISLSASGTQTPGTLTISVNSSGMAVGTYNGSVILSAPGTTNSPITIPVTMALQNAVLSVSPSSTMTFFGAVGSSPNPQTIQIANLGTGSLNWTATKTNSWLGISPAAGAAPSTITVSPSTATTGTGSFSDTIVISSSNVANTPINVPVSMQVGTLLFSDDFGTTPDGNWTVGPLGFASGWSIVNGAYTYNGGGHTQSWAGSSSWTDYTVSTDFQLVSFNNYPGGLRGRVNTTTGACYGVWIYPGEKVLRLFRIGSWNIDTDLSQLGISGPINIDTNAHNLRLVFQGTTIQVYYDNVLAIAATDSSYSQGAVALDVSSQPISFDNVAVISLP